MNGLSLFFPAYGLAPTYIRVTWMTLDLMYNSNSIHPEQPLSSIRIIWVHSRASVQIKPFYMLINAKQAQPRPLVFFSCCPSFIQDGDPDGNKPPCNSQELEDCDGFPEDGSSLTHFDGESLEPTQVVSNISLLH